MIKKNKKIKNPESYNNSSKIKNPTNEKSKRVETKERECWKFLDWRLNSYAYPRRILEEKKKKKYDNESSDEPT